MFAVAGGSEGHYVHVEVLMEPTTSSADYHEARCLMLGKGCDGSRTGWDAAWRAAQDIAWALGA